jgi:hypothetical protein
MTSIALVTCAALPELDPDELLLKSGLEAEGFDVASCVWSDDSVDWAAYDLVVVRSPWDYTERHEEFLAWAKRVDAVTTLLNPADVIEWNTDKRYLRDLLDAGVPVVPTVFLEPDGITEWEPPVGFAEYVVKPAVSAGSRDTMRYIAAESMDAPRAHAKRLLDENRVVMIQPYLEAVDTVGETAVIYMGGEFSHSIRKGPMLSPNAEGERVEGLYVVETIDPRIPTEAEHAAARAVLAAIPGGSDRVLYARVDLIPGRDGEPLLLELELTEPSLFFSKHESAAANMVKAIKARL